MTLIKLNDELGTVINLKYVEYLYTEYINCSKPYYAINIRFVSGDLKELRYKLAYSDVYKRDIDNINKFITR